MKFAGKAQIGPCITLRPYAYRREAAPLLRQYRKEWGMTQEQFAEYLGFRHTTYRPWEQGNTSLPWKAWVKIQDMCPCPEILDLGT